MERSVLRCSSGEGDRCVDGYGLSYGDVCVRGIDHRTSCLGDVDTWAGCGHGGIECPIPLPNVIPVPQSVL